AVVVELGAGDPADEAVGHPRRDLPEQQLVLAVLAPAADDVVALVHLGEEPGEVVGVVLLVAVHEDDDLAAGVAETGADRGGLAEVAAELDDPDPRVALVPG